VPEFVAGVALVRERVPELQVIDLAGLGGHAREYILAARLLGQDLVRPRRDRHRRAGPGNGEDERADQEDDPGARPPGRFPQIHGILSGRHSWLRACLTAAAVTLGAAATVWCPRLWERKCGQTRKNSPVTRS
jgi:hypothetical protein